MKLDVEKLNALRGSAEVCCAILAKDEFQSFQLIFGALVLLD